MAISKNPRPKNRVSKSSSPKTAKAKKSDSGAKKVRAASAAKRVAAGGARKGSKKPAKMPVLQAEKVEKVADVRAGKKPVKRDQKRAAETEAAAAKRDAAQILKAKVAHLKGELVKIDAEVQDLSMSKPVSARVLADRIGELGALLKALAAHTGALSKQVTQLEAVSAGHGSEEVRTDDMLRELVPELRERRQSAARFYADDDEA